MWIDHVTGQEIEDDFGVECDEKDYRRRLHRRAQPYQMGNPEDPPEGEDDGTD